MGDIENVKVYGCDRTNPHTGTMAMRLAYTKGNQGWGGVYWQYPENNWGDLNSGIDLTGATRVSFWARSDIPGTSVEFLVGGIGYATDYAGNTLCSKPASASPDSVCPKIAKQFTLTSSWTKYSIPLPPTANLSKIIGGFGWITDHTVSFFLDDIQYEFD